MKCQTNSRVSSPTTYVKISWWPSSLSIFRAASPRYFSATFRKQASNLCSEYLSFQCPLEIHPRIEILLKSSFAIVWYCSTHWATDMCSLPSIIAIRPPVLVPATTSNTSLGAMCSSGRSNATRRSNSWRMRRDDKPRTPPPSACSQLPVGIGQVGLGICLSLSTSALAYRLGATLGSWADSQKSFHSELQIRAAENPFSKLWRTGEPSTPRATKAPAPCRRELTWTHSQVQPRQAGGTQKVGTARIRCLKPLCESLKSNLRSKLVWQRNTHQLQIRWAMNVFCTSDWGHPRRQRQPP